MKLINTMYIGLVFGGKFDKYCIAMQIIVYQGLIVIFSSGISLALPWFAGRLE